jgi:hypothetical protein
LTTSELELLLPVFQSYYQIDYDTYTGCWRAGTSGTGRNTAAYVTDLLVNINNKIHTVRPFGAPTATTTTILYPNDITNSFMNTMNNTNTHPYDYYNDNFTTSLPTINTLSNTLSNISPTSISSIAQDDEPLFEICSLSSNKFKEILTIYDKLTYEIIPTYQKLDHRNEDNLMRLQHYKEDVCGVIGCVYFEQFTSVIVCSVTTAVEAIYKMLKNITEITDNNRVSSINSDEVESEAIIANSNIISVSLIEAMRRFLHMAYKLVLLHCVSINLFSCAVISNFYQWHFFLLAF